MSAFLTTNTAGKSRFGAAVAVTLGVPALTQLCTPARGALRVLVLHSLALAACRSTQGQWVVYAWRKLTRTAPQGCHGMPKGPHVYGFSSKSFELWNLVPALCWKSPGWLAPLAGTRAQLGRQVLGYSLYKCAAVFFTQAPGVPVARAAGGGQNLR